MLEGQNPLLFWFVLLFECYACGYNSLQMFSIKKVLNGKSHTCLCYAHGLVQETPPRPQRPQQWLKPLGLFQVYLCALLAS